MTVALALSGTRMRVVGSPNLAFRPAPGRLPPWALGEFVVSMATILGFVHYQE